MRLPLKPPPTADILGDPGLSSESILRIVRSGAFSATVGDRYYHWDRLRYRPLPHDLHSHEEWWSAVKLARRSLYRFLPFEDSEGNPFRLANPDPLQRQVSEIDRDLSGRVEISQELTNPGTRDRYVVSALIEEAITSSQLEGASTTRRVASDMLRSGRRPRSIDERMIVNNFEAMRFVRELVGKPITPELIFEIHRRVTADTLDDPREAGQLRNCPIQVAMRNDLVVHTGPPADQLERRMQQLCDFANQKSPDYFIHPISRAAITHFMVGYDHPFTDGNGRTARALFYWSMLNSGYKLCEFVSISHILRQAPIQYSKAYLYSESDENDVTYFVLYQLDVLQRAIKALHEYVRTKVRAIRSTQAIARQSLLFNHRQLALLSHALGNPDGQYTTFSHATSHLVSRQTALTDLKALVGLGLLTAIQAGKGQIYYPAGDLETRLGELGEGRGRGATSSPPAAR